MCEPTTSFMGKVGRSLEPVHEALLAQQMLVAGVEQVEERLFLQSVLNLLTPEERAVIEFSFGLKGNPDASEFPGIALMSSAGLDARCEVALDRLRAACGVGR